MKALLSILLLVGILGWSIGCIDEDELRGSSESPSIVTVTPDAGYPGDTVTLSGERFQDIETDSVFVNGVYSRTISHTNEEIRFVVADTASTGPVAVSTPLGFAIGPDFIVLNDNIQEIVINSISPTSGPELTVVTIIGQNFGSNLSDVDVTINNEPCQVNSVSDTEIEFIVSMGATTGPVKVSNTATLQEVTGPVFTVEIPEPVITVSTVVGLSQNDNVGNPWQIVSDGAGNFYFTDPGNHQIKKITSTGVAIYAGTGAQGFTNGKTTEATFNSPAGLAIDGQGNLYVADVGNHAIRLINTSQVVSTLAGIGQAGFANGLAQQQAQFNTPVDVAIDGNLLFISDFGNHAIRQLDIQDDMVTTVAGNGTSGFVDGDIQTARFNSPIGITLDLNDNLLIADALNHSIRLLDRGASSVSTITGNGSNGFVDGGVAEARFNIPYDVGIDDAGVIYVPDRLNHSIRKVENTITTTLAGTGVAGFTDGDVDQAEFNDPYGLAVVSASEIWVCDFTNGLIRKITIE